MDFDRVLTHLQNACRLPLPGPAAQAMMAPLPRREWPADLHPAHIRHAAGLLLLFPLDGDPYLVFTVRAHTLDRHSGQVSLPGGAVEPGETLEQAAIREAHEEIALAPALVRPIGALTPIDIPISGFRLHPILAAAEARPAMRPSDGEVAQILEVPLAALLDPHRIVRRSVTRAGRTFQAPAFPTDAGAEIWGATAMVVAELLAMLGWPGPRDLPAT